MTTPTPTAGLLEVALAAEDENFVRRIRAAMYQVATETLLSGTTSGEAPTRKIYIAAQVAASPDLYVKQFTWIAAAVPEVRDTVTVSPEGVVTVGASDEVLIAIARSTWDTLANR